LRKPKKEKEKERTILFGTYEPLSIMKSDWPIDGTLAKIEIPALPLPLLPIKGNQLFV